jgi:hypothetical protein
VSRLDDLHHAACLVMFLFAAISFAALTFVRAPYGRYARGGWGPALPARVAWVLMECPSMLLVAGIFLAGRHRAALAPIALLVLWQWHYAHRTVVYPFTLPAGARPMPLAVVFMGAGFNVFNAWLNARWISHLGSYPARWLLDPRFVAGVALFALGLRINRRADAMLRALRAPGETGYKIPRGWLYELVSCPNYLGELLEWLGWALATWSLPGLGFAVYTAANLVPRALAHHAWYRKQFPEYPPQRRAVIPFLL